MLHNARTPLEDATAFWHVGLMKYIIALSAFMLALPAAAQDLLSAEEFDTYTRGKTLFYGRDGAAYGAEIYHENRRVTWSFLDGLCKKGEWYEADGLICFVYEDNPSPQCWSFARGDNGLIARFEDNPTTTELYEAKDSDEEMICLGPKVGV
jgi:hypothetical protein